MQDYLDLLRVQMPNEPFLSSNICWFCSQPRAERQWAAEVHLNRNTKIEFGLTGTRYEWLVISRQIPCCQICYLIHEKVGKWSRTLMIAGGVCGFILGLILPFVIFLNFNFQVNKDFNGIVLFSMAGGTISGVIIGFFLGRRIAFSTSAETKPKKFAIQHPLLRPLIQQGWRFGKPN